MLICLISDLTDFRLIEQGSFKRRIEEFDPMVSFEFIVGMMSSHVEVNNLYLSFRVLTAPLKPSSFLDLFLSDQSRQKKLPEKLIGDHTRLQQVLVNLIKATIKICENKTINILAAYE